MCRHWHKHPETESRNCGALRLVMFRPQQDAVSTTARAPSSHHWEFR